jgi:hypothetical protein
MNKLSLSFFCITLLMGCSSNNVVKQDKLNATSDYFSDSSECSKVTLRNNQRVNIPMGKNPNVYMSCMKQKGWTVTTADTSDYRAVSTACQEEAKGTENVDASYADCIKRSQEKNDDK